MMSAKSLFLACALALGLVPGASAQTAFLFHLSGSQVAPVPVVTPATGLGLVVLNAAMTQITVDVHHTVTNPNAAHIHIGTPGAAGGIEIPLGGFTSPISGTFAITSAQVSSLQAGNLYVNIHSVSSPGGEIRGQIVNPFAPQVFISEFCSDPNGPGGIIDTNLDGNLNSSEDEFMEIVNGTNQSVNLGGWTVEDSVTVRHTLVANTILPPLSSITVFGGGSVANFNSLGMLGVTADTGFLGFNNGGDTITLRDNLLNIVDTHVYVGISDGESEARSPQTAGSTFVLHSSLPGGALHSAGSWGDDGSIMWPAGSLPVATYPGTGEDFTQGSGVGAAPTSGPGNDIKTAVGGDLLSIEIESSGGAFVGQPYLVLAEAFPTGNPPVGILPTLHLSFAGFAVLVDGATPVAPGFQPAIQFGGNSFGFIVPMGLSGTSVIIQSLALDPTALNGLFATSDGHEIQIL